MRLLSEIPSPKSPMPIRCNFAERLSPRQKMALSAFACVVVALAAVPWRGWLDQANVVMLFLLTVLVVAVGLGRNPAVLAAVLGVLLFDILFVPPHFSLAVSDLQYLITFAVMLATALITGHLAATLQEQAADAGRRERRTRALYEIARQLAGALNEQQVREILEGFVAAEFAGRCRLLLGDTAAAIVADADWLSTARAADVHGGGTRQIDGAVIYLPLKAPMRVRGVVAVAPVDGDAYELLAQRQRLETMASLVAIAIERVHYVDVAQRTQVQMVSERLRSSILSALSHDLRTPLTSLVGLADSLTISRPPLGAVALETAVAIRDQAERMAGLVGNLLDMARLHAGDVTLLKEWQPIEEVIGSSIKLLGRALAEHPVKVTLAKGLPLVEFDAVLIESVFCNLLENAAKYSPPGAGVAIDVASRDGMLEVTVSDGGKGFTSDNGIAVFEMFVRGEAESSKPGVGLGLAICSAIVEAHGGSISAANGEHGGARVCFTLPLGNPPSIEEEAPSSEDLA